MEEKTIRTLTCLIEDNSVLENFLKTCGIRNKDINNYLGYPEKSGMGGFSEPIPETVDMHLIVDHKYYASSPSKVEIYMDNSKDRETYEKLTLLLEKNSIPYNIESRKTYSILESK